VNNLLKRDHSSEKELTGGNDPTTIGYEANVKTAAPPQRLSLNACWLTKLYEQYWYGNYLWNYGAIVIDNSIINIKDTHLRLYDSV